MFDTITGIIIGLIGAALYWAGFATAALIIRDGLVKGKPKVNNSNTTNEQFSTKYYQK